MSGWAPVSLPTTGSGGDPASGVPTVVYTTRVAYPIANAEQSIALPIGTSRIYAGPENMNAKMRFSYVAGGTGIGNQYVTVQVGNSYDRFGMELAGNTLYYSANKAGITIEFEVWV